MSHQPPSRDELHEGGTNLSFELELEEDFESEIQHFSKLSRERNYAKAHEFFDSVLKKHIGFFPVAVEYADMLYEQGCYRQLSKFLEERIDAIRDKWPKDETQLLRLMNALAGIHYRGSLDTALAEAAVAWNFLERKQQLRGFLQLGLQDLQKTDNLPSDVDEISRMNFDSPDDSKRLPVLNWTRYSGPDMWASVEIYILQAEYLLNVAILANAAGAGDDTTKELYEGGRNQLKTARKIWRGIPQVGDSLASILRLSMEQICYETAKVLLFPEPIPKSADTSLALSKILSVAESLCDFRTQMRCRFQLLLVTLRSTGDWRDLYSMSKLQEGDCGDLVESLHTWNLFASWTLRVPISHFNLSNLNLTGVMLNLDREILFLSLIKPLGWPDQNWIRLLRSHFSKVQSVGSLLAWDASGDGTKLLIDIANYAFWSQENKNQLLWDASTERENRDLLGLSASMKSRILVFVQHHRRPPSFSLPPDLSGRVYGPELTAKEDDEKETVFKGSATEAQQHVEVAKKQEHHLQRERIEDEDEEKKETFKHKMLDIIREFPQMAKTARRPSSPEVQNALACARACAREFEHGPEYGPDAHTMAVLEFSMNGLWERIKAEPEYVLSPKEFSLLNYFFLRYKNEPACKRAVKRFWNHYGAENSATDESKS
ncbi:hypothetical protein AtubIFM54640_005775 [Aspergillus tubingensis]|nr:hypothetical protein AtubIFM54640_005775 [Aspergillus tubingensis]